MPRGELERGEARASAPSNAARGALRAWPFWAGAVLLGLGLRVALLPLAPIHGYLWDHDDMVRWGIQATDQGLLTLYDVRAPRHDARVWSEGHWVVSQRRVDRFFFYPPLMAYPTYAAGWVHKWLSDDRMINTVTARGVFGGLSIVSDVFLAWGCAALATLLGSARAGRLAFVLVLFAPPIVWVSSIWCQLDSVVMAPLVWMVWAMCSGRWAAAGVLFGAALMLKPQAVLFAPVWLLAPSTARSWRLPLLGLLWAAVAVAAAALPFTWQSGLAWWRISYVENLVTLFPWTTLKAFNLWYAEALVHESLDVTRRWWGLSMDAWGRLLFGVALVASLAGILWRWGRRPHLLLLCAATATLLSVMLGTRVHERYLLTSLPFLIVAAALRRRFLLALVPLLIAATAQVTWTEWLEMDAGQWPGVEAAARAQHEQQVAALSPERRPQARSVEQHVALVRQRYLEVRRRTEPIEWALVVLALGGTAAFVAAALWYDERDEVSRFGRALGCGSPLTATLER